MEHAKKLILIEPRVLEQMKLHSEYKDMERPADKKTKAGLSVDLQNVLREVDEGDDVKAKKYQQMFNRFMKMSSKMPETEEVAINSSAPRRAAINATAHPRNVRTPKSRRKRSRLNWDQY